MECLSSLYSYNFNPSTSKLLTWGFFELLVWFIVVVIKIPYLAGPLQELSLSDLQVNMQEKVIPTVSETE